MADVIIFRPDLLMSGPAALMRTIFRSVRENAADVPDLMLWVAREEEFDAQGGWILAELSPAALRRLHEVVMRMDNDLPTVASNWNEPFRAKLCHYFMQFKQKLSERIDALEQHDHK